MHPRLPSELTISTPQVVFCGIMLFEERVSHIQTVGYLISLGFFIVYNYLQLKDAGHCLD